MSRSPLRQARQVTHDLEILLASSGAARIADLTHHVSERSVRTWVKQGRLRLLHPGVVALADRRADWLVRAHAAVLHTRGQLSHTTALALWEMIEDKGLCLHVSVSPDRGVRSGSGLVVHRRAAAERPYDIAGLPVTGLDAALLDSWSLLNRRTAQSGSVQLARAAVINAVRSGRTSVRRLRDAISTRPNLAARSGFCELLDLIAGGCQSELEIWGVRQVLRIDGIPNFVQQYRVDLPGGAAYLDAALPDAKLGIELDGAAFHGDSLARERDIARDAALAALGWMVLRFSYRRLINDPDGCRRDIAAAYRRRLSRG